MQLKYHFFQELSERNNFYPHKLLYISLSLICVLLFTDHLLSDYIGSAARQRSNTHEYKTLIIMELYISIYIHIFSNIQGKHYTAYTAENISSFHLSQKRDILLFF